MMTTIVFIFSIAFSLSLCRFLKNKKKVMITFLFQSVGSPQVPCRFNAKKFKVHSRADAFIVAIFSLNFLISFRLFEEIVGL